MVYDSYNISEEIFYGTFDHSLTINNYNQPHTTLSSVFYLKIKCCKPFMGISLKVLWKVVQINHADFTEFTGCTE